jgi:hypothetical protein
VPRAFFPNLITKNLERTTMSYVHNPGKYESEPHATVYADWLSLDGDGETYSDGDGGESYTVIDGPFDAESVGRFNLDNPDYRLDADDHEIMLNAIGVILCESSQGFVSATWYTNRESYDADVKEIEDLYCAEDMT